MSRYGKLVDGLARSAELERRLVDLYRHAGDAAKHDVTARALHTLADRHYGHLERLVHLREHLQREHGEGFLGEAMESMGDAFARAVLSIPVMMIETETNASLDTLRRFEAELLQMYEQMLPMAADGDVKPMIESVIEDERRNISRLEAIDPLK